MRLTAFQSDKGDCLLLETKDQKNRMLIDGGMSRAYSEHVAPALGALRKAKKKLDVVYLSHIDQDHISGVLQMLDDEAAWRVHDHQLAHGNPTHKPPKAPRPPEVGRIFHNSFHDQVGKNSGPIESMLAATAQILSGSDHPWLRKVAQERSEIATSIPEAMRVSSRIKSGQLNIKLNPEYQGKLMVIKTGAPAIKVGSIRLKLIGPFAQDLKNLRKEWNTWLDDNLKVVKGLRTRAAQDEKNMSTNTLDDVIGPQLTAASVLGEVELALAKTLGERKKVTAPNLASLMFLAEENGQTILLTGDGHWADILKGLDDAKSFDASNHCHVDVLKVQHHGSEHNIEKEFCDRVTADHYVFCGNGQHENPDNDVLDVIFDRRMANDKDKFKFWFNSSSKESHDANGRKHMKGVEAQVAKLITKSKGRLKVEYIKGSSMRIV
jgi:beta-lactamase superfamily II metal-dependent hydrolase